VWVLFNAQVNMHSVQVQNLLTHCSPGRTLKHLAAMGYVQEVEMDTYQPTNFSRALTLPIIGDGYKLVYIAVALPPFSRECSATVLFDLENEMHLAEISIAIT
jgi:hypothetical protein